MAASDNFTTLCIIARSLLLLSSIVSMSTAYSLLGKRALVTGSSGGIGKGIALELGRQGCHVLVHYHQRQQGAESTAQEIQAAGGISSGIIQADFRDTPEIHRLFRELDTIWPEGLDILINNAGIVTKVALEDEDAELSAWHECMAVNLHAPRLLSHLALPRMKQRGGGVILNVSSIHGEKSNEYVAAYAASKSALDSLTRSMAMEYAAYNIRVNAIAPGVVPVERTAQVFADPAVAQSWADRIPLRRLGAVDQVAAATIPLITNEWVTGAIWQIDGGMMARSNMPDRQRPLPLPDGFA
jgi:glucose 1-dehydrogenase